MIMIRNSNMVVAFVVGVVLVMSGCVKAGTRLEIKIPPSATSVKFLHPSPNEIDVNFVIETQPFSLEYVNDIRRQITKLGYALCKKSAISNWQYLPTLAANNGVIEHWIVEMYVKNNYRGFMLLRVDESVDKTKKIASQKFIVVSHEVDSGEQNFHNISEFCELKANQPPGSRIGS